MKANIGSTDKLVRLLLAIILAGLTIFKVVTGTLAVVFLVVAIVLLATAFMNFCPIWHFLGVNTRKKTKDQ